MESLFRSNIGASLYSTKMGTTEWKEEDPEPRQGYIASSREDLYTNIGICSGGSEL